MTEETKKNNKSKSKKDKIEINPNLNVDAQSLRLEHADVILEVLSRLGRMKLARIMRKRAQSGELLRSRRKKELQSMTMKRASGLGWRGARRQYKERMAKGRDYSKLSASEKSRIERVASKRKERIRQIARVITRDKLKEQVGLNEAFQLMLENKRWHQLLNKDNTVKFDARFKLYRRPQDEFDDKEAVDVVSSMHNTISNTQTNENYATRLKVAQTILETAVEKDKSKNVLEHALSISSVFNLDHLDLVEVIDD
jgi:hypothetical protein